MATFHDLNDKPLQKLLTCAICSNYYQDPYLLPCSHTFCFQCIQNSVKNGSFNCPLQDGMKIAQNDINQLPINRTAKDLVEFVRSINLSANQELIHQCDECDENEAINWCTKCEFYYCESCTESAHTSKASRSHTIIPAGEKIQPFCMNHSGKILTDWCKRCETPLCGDCRLFDHKDHAVLSLDEAISATKRKFQETVHEIDEMKRNLTTFSERTKSIIYQQREALRLEKKDIEQSFTCLQNLLEERKRAIIKQLEDNVLQTMNILNQQQNSIDQHLKLTIAQELCIKKMLDFNDPMQILKFKFTLYHNYKEFVEQYNQIDDGYVIKTYILKKQDKDLEQILDIILKLGRINSTSWMIKPDSVTIKTSSLDISRVDTITGLITKESSIARGYKFSLKKSLNLRSIQIHSDHVGQITGFAMNDAGIIVQKGTMISTNASMKWLRIPLECDIQNNYSVLVLTPSDNGSYTYKYGDNQPRIINPNFIVESKYVQSVTHINVGSKMTIENNTSSIDMILDIED